MNDGNDNNMKLEITQDKLVDLLMHSATRQDIAEVKTELKFEIEKIEAGLKSDIADVKTELKSDIAEVKTELKSDMKVIVEKVDNNFKWLAGILVVGLLIPIILQFVK